MSGPKASASGSGHDYDWIVIGSGFGGSVAALRLAEKGYRVCVLEQGRRYRDRDLPRSAWDLRRFLWRPGLGLRGILRREVLGHVTVLSGVGVGGGSLVYANTLFRPTSATFFDHPNWSALGDWRRELEPHFDTAEQMLGVEDFAGEGTSEALMSEVATAMGVEETLRTTRVGVNMSGPNGTDPYFDGAGPERNPCVACGQCMLGCRYGAKNTLVKNYLWFAERAGAEIRPDSQVRSIGTAGEADDGSTGYRLVVGRAGILPRGSKTLTAAGVVVAAGTLGTNTLLLNAKRDGTLPKLSDRVGKLVRTNSEAITAVTARRRATDLRSDIAITRSVYADPRTHFTNNTFGRGGDALATTYGPLTAGSEASSRRAQFAKALLRHPLRWLGHFALPFGWSRRTVIFTVMQDLDNSIELEVDGRGRARSAIGVGDAPSAWLPVANEVAEHAAKIVDGVPMSSVAESLQGSPTSAHFLGGAVIGESARTGVVDRDRHAFGYRRLIVCDGSTLPANVGVNPSLTITAMAEEAMSRVPEKTKSDELGPRTAEPAVEFKTNRLHTTIRKEFKKLPAPSSAAQLVGTYDGIYIGPTIVRATAPLFMRLLRFGGWRGKHFEVAGDQLSGENLFKSSDGEQRKVPMNPSLTESAIDGRPAFVITYPAGTVAPWQRARDEFRPIDDDRLLGITSFDFPIVRHFPLAFVLKRR